MIVPKTTALGPHKASGNRMDTQMDMQNSAMRRCNLDRFEAAAAGDGFDILNNVLREAEDGPRAKQDTSSRDFGIGKLDHLIRDMSRIALQDADEPEWIAEPEPKKAAERNLRKKMTHYLSTESKERLDTASRKIADIVGADPAYRISKSRIIEISLDIVLSDFNSKGGKSLLMQTILKKGEK
jgi:hypothetical protein